MSRRSKRRVVDDFMENLYSISLYTTALGSKKRAELQKKVSWAYASPSPKQFGSRLKVVLRRLLHDRHAYVLQKRAKTARSGSNALRDFTNRVTLLHKNESKGANLPTLYVKLAPLDLYDDAAAYKEYAAETMRLIRAAQRTIGSRRYGVIVDVRQNHGGLLRRMFQILSCITRHVRIAWRGVKAQGVRPHSEARLEQSGRSLIIDGASLGVRPPRREAAKIAVLIDGRTASAGEMCAISLIGRPHVKTFGSHTYGIPTFINGFTAKWGTTVGVSAAASYDSRGKRYVGPLIPDRRTRSPVADALAWINRAV